MNSIKINAAKNSLLPLLCTCLIKPGIYKYQITETDLNSDCYEIIEYMKQFNVKSFFKDNIFYLDSSNMRIKNMIELKESKIRAVYYFYSTLSNSKKKIIFPKPKGCDIGDRKIDIHLELLKIFQLETIDLGDKIMIDYTNKNYNLNLNYTFKTISVGATINAIYLSIFNKGKIILNNCSIDPYIINLIETLQNFDINIKLTDRQITIINSNLKKDLPIINVIPDPIISATYIIFLTLFQNDKIILDNLILENLGDLYILFKHIGINFNSIRNNSYYLSFNDKLNNFNIETKEFPGIYTDVMPFLVILGSEIGNCSIKENIMNNRFGFAYELKNLGLVFEIDDNKINIKSNSFTDINSSCTATDLISCTTTDLISCTATDLRGGMAILMYSLLIILKSNSIIKISNFEYLERGYTNIMQNMQIIINKKIYYNQTKSEISLSSKPISLHSALG